MHPWAREGGGEKTKVTREDGEEVVPLRVAPPPPKEDPAHKVNDVPDVRPQ